MLGVRSMEGLGTGFSLLRLAAKKPSLHLEVIAPVGATAMSELPDAGRNIGGKEGNAPTLVLLDMNEFVRTQLLQLLASSGDDDMAQRDCPKWKQPSQPLARRFTLAQTDLQHTEAALGLAPERQGDRSECKAHERTRSRPCELQEACAATALHLRCLTFDMRGGRQLAKPDVARPLDGRVRRQLSH